MRGGLPHEPARQQEGSHLTPSQSSRAHFTWRAASRSPSTPAGARWHSLRTANTARKYVAISLAQLGRVDEARAEIAELIKHQPDASLALFRLQGFRHKWMQELHMEGLRKAGLREE